MPQNAFILILTDDEPRGGALRDALHGKHGHLVTVFTALDDAIASIGKKPPDVVVADRRQEPQAVLPGLVAALDARTRDATLLAVGPLNGSLGRKSVPIAEYPPDTPQSELIDLIDRAARKSVGRREERLIKESMAGTEIPIFEGIVGASPRIRQIVERIRKAARNKLTVLILGETGTGKDLIARAIHRHSDRANRPFKALNCAGLNEGLLESELFGHVRGSFTSAVADRKGFFEAAHGGTLFLDEIGDMPQTMQAKLLRALDNREITPVGSTELRRIDVRVVAATNRDLAALQEQRKFRDDLFYRLHQWVIEVPPLRDRRQDIPLLVHHFIALANREHGVDVEGVTNDAMIALAKHYWPGNVRELKGVIETACVEAGSGQLDLEHLPESIRGSRAIVPATFTNITGLTIAEMEKLLIQHSLASTGGNREQTARLLGIGTRTLYRKIREYGL